MPVSNILLVGGQSTGKTTLIDLMQHLHQVSADTNVLRVNNFTVRFDPNNEKKKFPMDPTLDMLMKRCELVCFVIDVGRLDTFKTLAEGFGQVLYDTTKRKILILHKIDLRCHQVHFADVQRFVHDHNFSAVVQTTCESLPSIKALVSVIKELTDNKSPPRRGSWRCCFG